MKNIQDIRATILNAVKTAFDSMFPNRAIKEVSTWDGAASNYPNTAAYCKACLINVNTGAEEDWVQSKCALPIRGPDDRAGTFVNKAIYAAAGGRGISRLVKPEDVDADTWEAAVKKAANVIISAYKEMDEIAPEAVYSAAGKERPEEASRVLSSWNVSEKIYEAITQKDEYAWINDAYFDTDGKYFCIVSSGGKLYRVDVAVADDQVTLGDWLEVVIDFPPKETEEAPTSEEAPPAKIALGADDQEGKISIEQGRGMIIRQQPDGKYRWISISCSSILNRMGEIDSTQLFDSFIDHAQKTGEYPIRMFYHAGEEFRTGQADFLGRDDYLLITSGIYDDSELARREVAARKESPDYWGDSIGFVLTEDAELFELQPGIVLPIYTKGIIREISTLPETQAASWMTATPTIKEVNRMLSKAQMEQFVKMFDGDEEAAKKWLDENAAERNRQIKDANLVVRQADPPAVSAETVENQAPGEETPGEEYPEGEKEIELDEETLAMLKEALGIDQIMQMHSEIIARLEALEGTASEARQSAEQSADEIRSRLKKLEGDEDEKRQAWLDDLPAKRTLTISHRPRTERNNPTTPEAELPESEQIAEGYLSKIPVKY